MLRDGTQEYLHVFIHANHRTLPPDFFEHNEAILDKQTLGTLVCDIQKVVSFDDGCVSILDTALSNRNRLMHGFYERHAIDLLSQRGREVVIRELEAYTETFEWKPTAVNPETTNKVSW